MEENFDNKILSVENELFHIKQNIHLVKTVQTLLITHIA